MNVHATPGDAGRFHRGSSGLYWTALYLLAMVLLFLGERVLGASETARTGLGAAGALGLVLSIAGRLWRRRGLPEQARSVETLILLCYGGGILAILVYLAQSDLAMEHLRALFAEPRGAVRYEGALAALWPVLWICSVLPLIFVEISYGPMDVARTLEAPRVRRSAASGLLLATTLSGLFLVNYMASEFDRKVDLSYFKTTHPSESSQKMVQNLSEDLRVLLFFPGANEVQEQVEGYFSALSRGQSRMKVEVKDHVLDPALAKELSVSENGVVVLVRGKQNQQISLGLKIEQAKNKLKKLDSEFQSAFRKLAKQQKIAYFTVGHEERTGQNRDELAGTAIRLMRETLEQFNYQVKDLSIAEGLGSGVPPDATVVFIVGPRKPFLPAEEVSLVKYLKDGGRAFVFLDPEAGESYSGLLGPFGLKFTPTRLCSDRFHMRITYTAADRQVIFTNRFSSHPSVSTLSRNMGQLATVMLGGGYLEEVPSTDGSKPNVQFTVHAMPSTWNDLDGNFELNGEAEKKRDYELAAVVTLQKPGSGGQKGEVKEDEGAKLVVVADSDALSDQVIRNPGNTYLFLDALKWLGGEEEAIGEVQSEEDVRIVHSRKEDQIWFYLTIFGVPALVLGGGLVYTRRRRRRS